MPSLNAVFRLNDGYSRVINAINRSTLLAERSIMGASRSTDRLNQSLDKTESAANKAMSGLKRLGAAAGGLFAVKKATEITDEYTNTVARLNMVNDGLQTQKELQDNIYRAAQRSRGAYDVMSQSVAKLGMMAGNAFGSTQEIVDFTELVNKSFKVGGASKGEQQAGMYQLSQAMASGRLQGDEFRSISENAPQIGLAIAKSLDIPIEKLKDMSSEGLITADVIKNAMFSMADEINEQFEKMPMTFSDVGTQIRNYAIYTFKDVMSSANDILNSDNIQNFINFFKGGIDILASAVLGLIQLIDGVATAVSNAWVAIEPFLLAAAFVLLPTIVFLLWSMLPPILAAIGAFFMAYAPIIMVVLIVGLVIAVLNEMGITTGAIVGSMTGSFMYLGTVLYNVFALGYNILSSFANFLGNIFKNPIRAVQKLFNEMGLYIMQVIQGIAKQIEKLINAIPGVEVSIASKLDGVVNWYKNNIKDIDSKAGFEDFVPKLEFKDVNKAYDKGYNWGNNAMESLGSGGIQPPGCIGDMNMNLGDYMSNGALPVTNGKGGGSSLNVSIDKEDIKYLKDIAERDFQAKYTQQTLAPNIQITFGDVKETADVNEVEKALERIIKEQIAVVGEG